MMSHYPKNLVFSFDLESTGLYSEIDSPRMIELALVPIDIEKKVLTSQPSFHIYVECPDISKLEESGEISDFVKGNESLRGVIKKASSSGISVEDAIKKLDDYLATFRTAGEGAKRATILSKSIGGLDRRLLGDTFGEEWVESRLTHQMIDVTSTARSNTHAKLGIVDTSSPKKLVKQLLGKEDVAHTAIEDAIDMAKVYLTIIQKTEDIKTERDFLRERIIAVENELHELKKKLKSG